MKDATFRNEHQLQSFLVDYHVGPALAIENFPGGFRIETMTGRYRVLIDPDISLTQVQVVPTFAGLVQGKFGNKPALLIKDE
ncbi:MAG: hypothetical protein AB7G80_00825 [Dongiaceae bacterium]